MATVREHFRRGSVESRVNVRIFALLGWLALTQSLSGAGLIVIHEQDFWRRPPPRIVPPEPWPRPPRPEPWIPPPPPVWAPMETLFTKADIRIRDQIATTVVEQEFYNPNARPLEG